MTRHIGEVVMSEDSAERSNAGIAKPLPDSIQTVIDALGKIKFGAIQLTVHEGKLVQVDVTERKRFVN